MNTKALVVFSGGQDSTTCLIWALQKFTDVTIVTFDYGQRHKKEIEQAIKIIEEIGCDLDIEMKHIIINIPLNLFLDTSMTDNSEINIDKETGLPTSFVPGRNLIFLTFAASYAYQHDIKHIITGVCQTDYSGYPDCRDATIKALQATIRLGMDKDIIIHTPLMWLNKKETIDLMDELGGLKYYKFTHTCYLGNRPACGKCPACLIRLRGFYEAGIEDPLDYEYKSSIEEIEEELYQKGLEQYKIEMKLILKKYNDEEEF
jgi:7-cyano-7-deazaguanine synthase